MIGSKIHVKPERAKYYPGPVVLQNASAISVVGQDDQDVFVLYQPSAAKEHPRIAPDAQVFSIARESIEYIESDLVAAAGGTDE